jgi:asparagine N-glycosylation enzyme membrane subunit Stt3
MKKDNLPLILIIACVVFIILNFIFTSDEMNSGFWLRIISSLLGILAMFLTIRERKKQRKNNSE